MTYYLSILFLVIAGLQWTAPAAEFRNLDFDEADTSGLAIDASKRPYGTGVAAKLLPHWSLFHGTAGYGAVTVNWFYDFTEYPLLGNSPVLGEVPEIGPRDLGFALRLGRDSSQSSAWTLQQTGTVPADAKYFTYRNWSSAMDVRINGKKIEPVNPYPMFNLAETITNLFYEVTEFAGREVKLELIGPFGPQTFPDRGGLAYVDSLAFIPARPKIRYVIGGTNSRTNYMIIYFYQRHERKVQVEYRDSLHEGSWQLLPGGPYSIGPVTDLLPGSQRFYRLRDADQ